MQEATSRKGASSEYGGERGSEDGAASSIYVKKPSALAVSTAGAGGERPAGGGKEGGKDGDWEKGSEGGESSADGSQAASGITSECVDVFCIPLFLQERKCWRPRRPSCSPERLCTGRLRVVRDGLPSIKLLQVHSCCHAGVAAGVTDGASTVDITVDARRGRLLKQLRKVGAESTALAALLVVCALVHAQRLPDSGLGCSALL